MYQSEGSTDYTYREFIGVQVHVFVDPYQSLILTTILRLQFHLSRNKIHIITDSSVRFDSLAPLNLFNIVALFLFGVFNFIEPGFTTYCFDQILSILLTQKALKYGYSDIGDNAMFATLRW